MKTPHSLLLLFATLAFVCKVTGQGTMIYDQESSTDQILPERIALIQLNSPIGQSFTPRLGQVGFVRFYFSDPVFNGLGANVFVRLVADNFTNGTVLASTEPVFMADTFHGITNFLFAEPVDVTPGQTYFFQVVVLSGDQWTIGFDNSFGYAGGTGYSRGMPTPAEDLWFREGIIIPEPGTLFLAIVGVGALLCRGQIRVK